MDDDRLEELESLAAIYPELIVDTSNKDAFCASIDLTVSPNDALLVRFVPSTDNSAVAQSDTQLQRVQSIRKAYVEHDVRLSHLPPLSLRATLAPTYPNESPPRVHLVAQAGWLPSSKIEELEQDVSRLWEEYGHCQILFAYIDHLQQAAERGFDLSGSVDGCLVLSVEAEPALLEYNQQKDKEIFEAGTYECGVCLDPKRGSLCYRLKRCGHVFCRQCLQDFYNNAISEGDVSGVKCLDPDCGVKKDSGSGRKRKRRERLIHPGELLDMGIEEKMVRRFVEMKRKKKLEADKTTVYCPRTWCQGAAKSAKYPPIPADLRAYVAEEVSSEDEAEPNGTHDPAKTQEVNRIPPNPSDRLAVCEKCDFAFCQVCYMGWHGPFARCYPRDPNELSAEEKASYEYIRLHTSPCAYCNVPVQKTMGCNHMCCFQCNTHFCYLCGAWLDPGNPYQHFNKEGTPCYQRLWELEAGDDGQAPQDGNGFAGGRGWEQLALQVAREADEAEGAAAAARAQEEEDRAVDHILPNLPQAPEQEIPLAVAMAQVNLIDQVQVVREEPQRNGRRRRNPFPAQPPAVGVAHAVRQHERGGRRRPVGGAPGDGADEVMNRQQAELQRFLEMAQRDEEDGWDSDDLGDDDERFVIR